MHLFASLLLTLTMVSFISADVDPIRFPPVPAPTPAPAPTPKPDPSPGPVPDLTNAARLLVDEWYVIDADVDVIVMASPAHLVTITKEAGPIRLRGKFIGESGKTKTKLFSGKSVHIIEGVNSGKAEFVKVEIIVVPVGAKTEADIRRRTIEVESGNGAIPPPGPEPGPTPKPKPVTSFRVILVYESGATITQAQSNVLYAKSVSDYLTSVCTKEGQLAGWRRFDKDIVSTDETPVMKALLEAVKPKLTTVPCVVIEVNGKAEILSLPGTPEEMVALLKKYNEGGK